MTVANGGYGQQANAFELNNFSDARFIAQGPRLTVNRCIKGQWPHLAIGRTARAYRYGPKVLLI